MRPRTCLRRRLVLLAVVPLGAAATLAGCTSFSDTVPGCADPLRLAIIAQSVPTASYLPCLGDLPQGWDASGSTRPGVAPASCSTPTDPPGGR